MPPIFMKEETKMNKEKFVQRLYRVFSDAGYTALEYLTISVEEMIEIPDIKIPEIKAALYLQKKYRRGEIAGIKKEVSRCERRKTNGGRV